MTTAAEHIVKTSEFITTCHGRVEGITHYDTLKIDDAIAKFMADCYENGHSHSFTLVGTRGNIANIQISPLLRSGKTFGGAVVYPWHRAA